MRLPLLLALACSLLLWALPAPAQEAEPCPPKRYVEGWLRDQGYALSDWGLMDGRLHELWQGPRGWAIVETMPNGCARVLSLPDAPRARPGGKLG